MSKWIVLLFLCASLQGRLIEFYADWAWNSKGTKLFTPEFDQNEEEWPVLWKIGDALQKKGWDIQCWDYDFYRPFLLKGDHSAFDDRDNSLWVFWNMGGRLKGFDLARVPKQKLVLFMWEPPTVQSSLYTSEVQNLFGKIFTWDDDLVDNEKFFKFHYPALKKRIDVIPDFHEKKFCVMINTFLKDKHPKSLYGQREIDARFFEDKEFDLYGRFWNGFKNWKGTVKDKAEVLKNYKFCICYENMKDVKGYITEKIFDCFQAGCVPIYWGASNVNEYIPLECFIDRRRFSNIEELYLFLKKMDQKQYQHYLDAAARYLNSPQAQVFSRDAFVKIFIDQLTRL